MKNERKFCICAHCGNIVSFLVKTGPGLLCCGKPMENLVPNTTDAAQEKHVPIAVRQGNKLVVTIGSAPHPMTDDHHIAWIVVADGARTQRLALTATQQPSAEFFVGNDPVTVYEYCNQHGLWAVEA